VKKIGAVVGLGATIAAAAITYTSVALADTQAPSQPSFAGPVSAYPPETPGAIPPRLGGDKFYPPITPGQLPPGLKLPLNQYPPITPGAQPPILRGPISAYPPETPGARPPGFGSPANQYPPETPAPAPADTPNAGGAGEASVG
jgi:hypothetical protein